MTSGAAPPTSPPVSPAPTGFPSPFPRPAPTPPTRLCAPRWRVQVDDDLRRPDVYLPSRLQVVHEQGTTHGDVCLVRLEGERRRPDRVVHRRLNVISPARGESSEARSK